MDYYSFLLYVFCCLFFSYAFVPQTSLSWHNAQDEYYLILERASPGLRKTGFSSSSFCCWLKLGSSMGLWKKHFKNPCMGDCGVARIFGGEKSESLSWLSNISSSSSPFPVGKVQLYLQQGWKKVSVQSFCFIWSLDPSEPSQSTAQPLLNWHGRHGPVLPREKAHMNRLMWVTKQEKETFFGYQGLCILRLWRNQEVFHNKQSTSQASKGFWWDGVQHLTNLLFSQIRLIDLYSQIPPPESFWLLLCMFLSPITSPKKSRRKGERVSKPLAIDP